MSKQKTQKVRFAQECACILQALRDGEEIHWHASDEDGPECAYESINRPYSEKSMDTLIDAGMICKVSPDNAYDEYNGIIALTEKGKNNENISG